MPCDDCRCETGGLGRLCGGEVVFFRRVGFEIVELGGRTFVGAEQFPTAVAHGEVGKIVIAGERGPVGWPPEKEWSVARGLGAAEECLTHGNPVEGRARRGGSTDDC